MSTIITQNKIRKGDKIKVTWSESNAEFSVTGVADTKDYAGDWKTAEHVWLLLRSHRDNHKIELLERPKTAEEILKERRDKLAVQLSEGWNHHYAELTSTSQAAIDRIIFLEDEKEALVN